MTLTTGSNAVLEHPLLDHETWTDWQDERHNNSATDLSTTSNTGQVADLIAIAIENSGTQAFYFINIKPVSNARMVRLLTRWIDEYGDDEDPNLDLQLAELRSSRLAFRERC